MVLPDPDLISIAPMIDKSHRYFRRIVRTMTRKTLLYTEMISAAAIIHGGRARLLDFDPEEKPLALQIGTGDPREAAEAVRIAEDWDYDEINLNLGCPSDRVQSGEFGACLMAEPERVSGILSAITSATRKPVTVKHRIGIESRIRELSLTSYEHMEAFVDRIADCGVQKFVVHARVAILEGLSPKENRTIPPLRHEDVYRLKEKRPGLKISINGGIKTLEQVRDQLAHVDGVMLGRLSYEDPFLLSALDQAFFDPALPAPSRRQVLEEVFDCYARWQAQGIRVRNLFWPILELFTGLPGTKRWKRYLSQSIPEDMDLKGFLGQAWEEAPQPYLDQGYRETPGGS